MIRSGLVDANALYPYYVKDLLVEYAVARGFRMRWTPQIEDEWIRNVVKNKITTTAETDRTCRLMKAAVKDWEIKGHMSHLNLAGPGTQENDRHVAAAAIVGKVDVLITNNVRHFDTTVLARHNIQVSTVDDFLLVELVQHQEKMLQAIKKCVDRFDRPPNTYAAYLDQLLKSDLSSFVSRVRPLLVGPGL